MLAEWMNELYFHAFGSSPFSSVKNLLLLYRFQATIGEYLIFYFLQVLLYSLPKPKLNIQSELKKNKNVINCYWNASGKWERISKKGFHFLVSPLRGQKDKKLRMLQSHAVPGGWKCLYLAVKFFSVGDGSDLWKIKEPLFLLSWHHYCC